MPNITLLVLKLQIPNLYAALPPGWPSHQQQQLQQQPQQSQQPHHQQGNAGQRQAPMHFPYPPFVPMLFPYGMPAPGAVPGLPPGPDMVHMIGEQHPGVPAAAAPGTSQQSTCFMAAAAAKISLVQLLLCLSLYASKQLKSQTLQSR